MAHFSVAVFRDNEDQTVDELLLPYEDVPEELEQFHGLTIAEIAENVKDDLQDEYDRYYAEWQSDPKAFAANHPSQYSDDYMKQLPERLKWTDEQLYRDAIKDYEDQLILDDDTVFYDNPRPPKWDWWVIGGRMKGTLIRKGSHGDATCDEALVSELDFEAMKRHALRKMQPYEEALKDSWNTEENIRKIFPTEEEYVKLESTFYTCAVVTPDGEWHEPGNTSIFHAKPKDVRKWYANYHKQFIKPALEKNWHLTIVDCHFIVL